MALSEKIQASLVTRKGTEAAKLPTKFKRTPKSKDPFFLSGLAVGVLGGIAIISVGMRPAPAPAPVPVPAPASAEVVAEPRNEFHNPSNKGQKCVPYASNGVYLPELCGDHDAFQGRLDRAFAPYDSEGRPQN